MGELNIFNLEDFVRDNNCKIYVETGTGMGVCLSHMLNYNFEHFYSVDIDGDLIDQARENFPQSNIDFIHDYSTHALKKLVPTLPANKPVLFFLDAHFPGADFGKMTYEKSIRQFKEEAFPLITEINAIKNNRDISQDSFIIDDWKLYDDTKSYEMPGWDYVELQKELGLKISADAILEKFSNTHNNEVRLRHQGFLFVTPKG
jgi:hypothetical protein